MSGTHAGAVVVGIDGSESAELALSWAADEAVRRGAPLVVAHAGDVCNQNPLSPQTAEIVAHEVSDFATSLLGDAVDEVTEDRPGIAITSVLRDGSPADVLRDLSFGAALLVVGRGRHGFVERVLIGSNARRLANDAHCPVVVVSETVPDAQAPIAVGVSPTENGLQAMRAACTEARLRGTSVIAIRSWSDFTWATVGAEFSVTTPIKSIQDAQRGVLNLVVGSFREAYPDVAITARLSVQPTDIALTAVPNAGLLVVGRRRDAQSHLSRLGPTSSWLVEHATYPVMVVGNDVATVPSDTGVLERITAMRPLAEATS